MDIKLLSLSLLLLPWNLYSLDEFDDGLNTSTNSLPPIKGISNLNQIESDMPSAYSEVDHDLFTKLGIYKIEDAMRLFPGVVVAMATDDNPFIQYHGTNALKQRMAIRFNGHDYTIGQIHKNSWRQFNFNDLRKITLSRSPGGANFGDRSFMAQMNLEPFSPHDLEGRSLKYITGSRKTHIVNTSASNNITPDLLFSVTASIQKTDGFDYEPDQSTKRWDYTDNKQINGKLIFDEGFHRFSLYTGIIEAENGSSFATGAGNNQPINNDPNDPISSSKTDIFFDYEFDNSDQIIRLSAGNQRFSSVQHWQVCIPSYFFIDSLADLSDINPDLSYAVAFNQSFNENGLTEQEDLLIDQFRNDITKLGEAAYQNSCYEVSQTPKTERTSVDGSYELEIITGLRSIFGINTYYETYASEIFLNGQIQNHGYNFYNQTEYKFNDYTINFGISSESGKSVESAVAVRGSFNWHIDSHNTLRFAYSEGYRTPDVLESSRDWRYKGKAINENPFGKSTLEYFYKNKISNELHSEKIKSYEISYLSNYDNMELDLKIFQDELEDLMNDNVAVFQHAVDNSSSNLIQGAETEVKLDLSPIQLGLVYAYLNYNTNSISEQLFNPKHIGSLYGIAELTETSTIALAFYGNSDISGEDYGRSDLTYTCDWDLAASILTFQAKYSYYNNDAFAIDVIDQSISK